MTTTNTAPYAVTYREPADADEATHNTVDALNVGGATGDIAEITATCVNVGCDADIYDAAGFRRGWVHADGSYTVT